MMVTRTAHHLVAATHLPTDEPLLRFPRLTVHLHQLHIKNTSSPPPFIMCIQQLSCCDDCGFSRPFAEINCALYLAKLIKFIGYGEGVRPKIQECADLEYETAVIIGRLGCPNEECPKFATAPAIRAQMEAGRQAKLHEKREKEVVEEARRREFAQKHFFRRKPTLPPKGSLLSEPVKAEKEKEATAPVKYGRSPPEERSKMAAFQQYMFQRQKSEGYANVFDDDSDDSCPSLSPDGRTIHSNGPKTPSLSMMAEPSSLPG
jgi:hypothetical protein